MPVLLLDNVAKSDIPIGTLLEITESHARDNHKDQPQFKVGERVAVIVNRRNKTVRHGAIASAIWRHKYSLWHYYLTDDGRSQERFSNTFLVSQGACPSLQREAGADAHAVAG